MVINTPKDHRKHSLFQFSRYWNITNIPTYLSAVRRLRTLTRRDGKGRIFCIGRVGYSFLTQERLYVVKLGHDGNIWQQVTPLGQEIKEKLGAK
jgi:hypothetical protein